MANKNYVPPRLGVPNPCNPATYNREQTERRMLSRQAGSSVVKPMDNATEQIDEKIASIKEQARKRITELATTATQQISKLEARKRSARKAKQK